MTSSADGLILNKVLVGNDDCDRDLPPLVDAAGTRRDEGCDCFAAAATLDMGAWFLLIESDVVCLVADVPATFKTWSLE